MRIECEVCAATFTIDDAQLSDQPIGAQCPYCGHVKLVRRGDAAFAQRAAPPPPAFSGGGGTGYGQTPLGSMGGGLDLGMSQVGPMNAPPFGMPSPPSYPYPGAGTAPVPNNDPFGFANAPPPSSPAETFGFSAPPPGLPAQDVAFDQGFLGRNGQEPPPAAGVDAHDRFAALEGVTAESAPKCQVCGNPLSDEFDKVIGLCDVHQRDRRSGDAQTNTTTAPAGFVEAPKWHVRGPDGSPVGPMSLEDLRARIRQGEFNKENEYSKDGKTYARISKFQELAYLVNLGIAGDTGSMARPRPTSARPADGKLGKWLLWAAVLLVVGGIGWFAYREHNRFVELYTRMTEPSSRSGTRAPNPLKIELANWRNAHPDVSGSAHQYIATARAKHLEDTWKGYQAASDAYEKAMLLDEDNPTAIAGYVENLAIWKYPLLTQEQARLAQAALRFASDAAPTDPLVHRATAALALAKGELDPCRAGADKALDRDATDGLAKLILAGCYLEGNVQLSISEAEKAGRLVPELRRADRVLASAYMKAGRFASAEKIIEARLKTDPKSAATVLLRGDLARELGQLDAAEERYKRAVDLTGDTQAAQLALADLYMEKENYGGAATEYKRAAEFKPSQAERTARALAGWAHAELRRNKPKEAIRIAKLALEIANNDPHAQLVQGEAELVAGTADVAASMARRVLEVRAGEPAALVLAARAAVAGGARDKAIKFLEEAIMNEPLDPRLKGILAAHYLDVGGTQQAYALMRKAADIDPAERSSRSRVGPFALSETAVRDAIQSFQKSASDEANASVALSSIGVLEYHLGDKTRAQDAITRALRVDDSNETALLYEAQIALDRGDADRAKRAAEKVLTIERGSALGHLLLARALARRDEAGPAAEAYDSALRSNPGLLAAQVERAGLRAKSGDKDAAVGEIARAFQVAPSNAVIRKLLYELGN